MLFAADVLTRNPGGQILYDVKCTRHLAPWVTEHGGAPLMCKTGHSLVKARMRETGAPLGGEMSGHVFFKDRWYGFDDGLYAGARMLELFEPGRRPVGAAECIAAIDQYAGMHLQLAEGENFALMDKLQREGHWWESLPYWLHLCYCRRRDWATGFRRIP